MDIDVIVQTVTPVLVVLTIIWHQTRSVDKLRDDLTHANDKLRDDFTGALGELTKEVAENGQRLARIEGFLGIGMPKEAAERAAGATILPADRQ